MKRPSLPVLKKAFRLVRRHGIPLLLERFVRRKEVLTSPPVACDPGSALEVHTQVCSRDWLNAIWTLKSLRAQCESAFSLFAYLDSNIPFQVRPIFEAHFPGIQIPRHDWLDEQVRRRLTPIAPAIAALWRARHSPTLCKMVNAWICARNERLLYLDPDVLFFAPPVELLEFIAKGGIGEGLGFFNVTGLIPESLEDSGAYCLVEAEVLQTYHLKLPRDFNAGLGAIRREAIDWPFLEKVLNTLQWRPDRAMMVDQTCFALLAERNGWERLDRNRYLAGEGRLLASVVTVHYLAGRRDFFYVEGIPKLRRQGFIRKLEKFLCPAPAAAINGAA